MWKALRVTVLLLVLATVAQGAWLAKRDATDWDDPLTVVLYPINADGSEAAERYLRALDVARYAPIAEFMADQAEAWGVRVREPVELRLAPRVGSAPPPTPAPGNPLAAVAWSLQLRWWAWRNDTYTGARRNVRLFLLYHDDERTPRLPHSTGLEKGLIGVVNVFANPRMSAQNNVVITHEMLHTLGATDKYDLATNQPLHPHGYAEPDRVPLLPQRFAEIMAGRVPVAPGRAEQAESLNGVLIGPLTAREIGWVR